MRHLKSLLFGIIFLSSIGSTFADEYDPKQDVFDQIINALVPTLIVFLFDRKGSEDKKKPGDNRETGNEENSAKLIKIKRVFDDFLFLLSLFVLPCIVFFKNHKEFATPLWIPILFGVAAGFVFIILMFNYIFSRNEYFTVVATFSAIAIDLSHVISDICFIFYTKNIPTNNFTDVFIYLHAVTGILGTILFVFYVSWGIILAIESAKDFYHNAIRDHIIKVEPFLRKSTLIITFIWTPIVQMLNMSLLSGNDYYWTKSILALNLIYFSRVLNYAGEKITRNIKEDQFGVLHNIFHYIRKIREDEWWL